MYRQGTICNMGAEVGATTSTFGYDIDGTLPACYQPRHLLPIWLMKWKNTWLLTPKFMPLPEKYFDQLIEINLDGQEPCKWILSRPTIATPINETGRKAKTNGWPTKVEVGLIGSCTNSSCEDISRCSITCPTSVCKNPKTKAEFTITPGSGTGSIHHWTRRFDWYVQSNWCYLPMPADRCIGQWSRRGLKRRKNTIIPRSAETSRSEPIRRIPAL